MRQELEVEGDKHAVLYIPSTAGVCIDVLELESIDPGAVSLILDNDPRIPVKYIYENDSSSPGKARDVFSSLFPGRVWMSELLTFEPLSPLRVHFNLATAPPLNPFRSLMRQRMPSR